MYYALHNGTRFLETGFNATSSMEMREHLFKAFEDKAIIDEMRTLASAPLKAITDVLGLRLLKQESPFIPKKNFRVIAAVTTYCYLDISADSAEEAKLIAENTDGGDYYTMEQEERPGSFDIVEVNPIP